MLKLKYKKPILTAIKLDQKQVCLVQCKVLGVFFHPGGGLTGCVGSTGMPKADCASPVRGVSATTPIGLPVNHAKPS